MLVQWHLKGTLADAGSLRNNTTWPMVLNSSFESTTHSRESNHKPYVYIYIYKCAIIYVWMLVWMFISRDTCKNKKKLAKPTECDHQPRTNSEAATKPNRHVAYLLFVCSDEASLPLWLWETFKCYDNRWNLPSSQQIRRHRLWPVYLCFFTSEAQKPFLRHNEAG